MKTRVIKPRPFSWGELAGFWLLVFVAPAVFIAGLLHESDQQKQRQVFLTGEKELYREMDAFARDLNIEAFVNRKLAHISRKLGNQKEMTTAPLRVWKEAWLDDFTTQFGFQPLFALFLDRKNGNTDIFSDARLMPPMSRPGPRTIRESLGFALQPQDEELILPGFAEADKRSIGETLLQNLLSIPLAPQFVSGVQTRVFSRKFGAQNFYLFLNTFPVGCEKEDRERGAYLIGFPVGLLRSQQIFRAAISRPDKGSVLRRLFVPPPGFHFPVSGVFHRRGRMVLRQSIPPVLLPVFDKRYPGRIPVLEVSRLSTSFGNESSSGMSWILLWIGGSAIGLLRFRLFQERIPLGLRAKMVFLTLFALLIPMAGFTGAARQYFRFQKDLDKRRTSEHLRRLLETEEGRCHEYSQGSQEQMQTFALGLGEFLDKPDSEIAAQLDRLRDMKTVDVAFFLKSDGSDILFLSEEAKRQTSKASRSTYVNAMKQIGISALNYMGFITDFEFRRLFSGIPPSVIGTVIARSMKEYHFNEVLTDPGRNWSFQQLAKQRFDIQFVHFRHETGGEKRIGSLVLLRVPISIARRFFRQTESNLHHYRKREGEYDLRWAVFEIVSETPLILSQKSVWPKGAEKDPSLVAIARKKMEKSPLEDLPEIIQEAHRFRTLPFVAVGIGEKRGGKFGDGIAGIAVALFFLYTVMMMVLTMRFLEISLVQPLVFLKETISQLAGAAMGKGVHLHSGDEFAAFAEAAGGMSRSLLEREHMRRFVSRFAVQAVSQGREGGRIEAEVTILFSDIRDFTTLSEQNAPEEVVQLLNEYFSVMEEVIEAHHGTIDKFIGDAIQAVFHRDIAGPDHREKALQAAWKMREALGKFNVCRESEGAFPINTGIGICSGLVIEGNVGSRAGRLDRTVIGKPVELAAGLESLSKYGVVSRIIIDNSMTEIAAGLEFQTLSGIPEGSPECFEVVEVRFP
jgi:class 3 adenylate cyclase